jgi:uncharacterized membrane-anchored protein
MDNNDKRAYWIKRLIRISLIVAVLLLLLKPDLHLPANLDVEGMLGGAILGGLLAAVGYRGWLDVKNKRNKKK